MKMGAQTYILAAHFSSVALFAFELAWNDKNCRSRGLIPDL